MSVGFANAVAAGLRYNSVTVSFEPGWETRGNGYTFPGGMPEGLITHHTGDNYGAGLAILVNGRSDLDPPLCNCCTYPDGRIHIIAAHCANHAGASGGKSMGPLPVTRLFNPRVWGNEVMFPGLTPWTAQQYRSARVLGAVISGILKRPSTQWVRGHFETSIEGKWDPGVGDGGAHSFDMNLFRAQTWAALTGRTVEEAMLGDPIPLVGSGRKIFSCPTGKADGFSQRRTVLNVVALDVKGAVQVEFFAQSDTAGTDHWTWTEKDLTQNKDNVYKRMYRELPDGTTKIVVNWDFHNAVDASLTIESKPTI